MNILNQFYKIFLTTLFLAPIKAHYRLFMVQTLVQMSFNTHTNELQTINVHQIYLADSY